MKLNRRQLRLLIESEAKNVDEGFMGSLVDKGIDAAENLAVTTLGHAIVGDAAAFFKAITLDLDRVIDDQMELHSLLSPFGIDLTKFMLAKDNSMDPAIANFAMSDQATRDQVMETIESLVRNNVKLLVSAVSAAPDGLISGAIAGGLTAAATLPLEKILPMLAEYVGKFLDFVDTLPGGEVATGFASLISRVLSGPAAWIFGDPVHAYRNLGKLVAATDGELPAGMESVGPEIDVTLIPISESKWLKIAGIK